MNGNNDSLLHLKSNTERTTPMFMISLTHDFNYSLYITVLMVSMPGRCCYLVHVNIYQADL